MTIIQLDSVTGDLTVGERTIHTVIGLNTDGAHLTQRDLRSRQLIDPADCQHTGAAWSTNLIMRCGRCGQKMFLPPQLLAYLPTATLTAMANLWAAAGWPEWDNRVRAWRLNQHWQLRRHPLFDHCLGIPVREDKTAEFADMVEELQE